ncbi:hypothetical protein [Paenibacillus paridis]|uniref:hypothetical protein n=1 Tax=Paenibacillus paridis TaxID=2583376 RepID=UPI0011203F9E|nr:hypothetical protein [Paenibacillus paridis]
MKVVIETATLLDAHEIIALQKQAYRIFNTKLLNERFSLVLMEKTNAKSNYWRNSLKIVKMSRKKELINSVINKIFFIITILLESILSENNVMDKYRVIIG